ncbi:MAG TPA: hypothetical protein VF169_09370 [Albitalea sp.]|uniref:hypothetical protein n=1 Tax=Piscinibacter sp. TaxID=1903157 RepID=UPI002ED5D7AB
MRCGDLSLTVSQRKLACVFDPALVLGHAAGPTLALRLTRVFEGWLTRSFWQVLDASELLQRRALQRDAALPDAHALAAWIALRDSTDAASWKLRWVGDSLPESQVGDEAEPDLVERYERLASALSARTMVRDSDAAAWARGLDPVIGALDTLALSACLDGALVLSHCTAAAHPWPAQALGRAGLAAIELDPMPADTLFATERALVRDAMASAGLAPLAESLPRLAVLHVALDPHVADLDLPASGDDDALRDTDPWAGAQAWWYRV